MKLVLIHPPLDDPTLPYHSTAYLKGHLAKNGFRDVILRDVNVEFVSHLLKPEVVVENVSLAKDRVRALSLKSTLNFDEQTQYLSLSSALKVNPRSLAQAVHVLRDPEQFVHFDLYRESIANLRSYTSLLGALSYPSSFEFFTQVTQGRYSLSHLPDLLDVTLGGLACRLFSAFFNCALVADRDFASADMFGISIVYDHQLQHAIHLCRLLRQNWPQKTIVLGGTAISQLYKYLKDKTRLKELFAFCDAIVIGEGETAICQLVAAAGDIGSRTFNNTITYDKVNDKLHIPEVQYEDLSSLGSPIYDHPWDLYLSPSRGINYSPTRGCYWNRCTFCDYGLNTDKPTSPWRERAIPDVIEDLRRAQSDFNVQFVYFAVDVMAPGYLERLSDALIEAQLNIRWSAELRMERIFSEERARKMRKAGCVCVSFGMESGNQRILDLIDKGTKVEYMGATMKNFATAGVACQLMGFTDFPTETTEEKNDTFNFIQENASFWSTGGVGSFLLTGTSIIAREPGRFGIALKDTEGTDIGRAIAFEVESNKTPTFLSAEEADASFNDCLGLLPAVFSRPWAGGTDSLHTMIYYAAHDRHFFKRHSPVPRREVLTLLPATLAACKILFDGALVTSPFSYAGIVHNRTRFFSYLKDMRGGLREPTATSLSQWAAAFPSLVFRDNTVTYWLLTETQCVRVDQLIYSVIQGAVDAGQHLDEVISQYPPEHKFEILNYLLRLEQRCVLSLELDGRKVISSRGEEERLRLTRCKNSESDSLTSSISARPGDELVLIQNAASRA